MLVHAVAHRKASKPQAAVPICLDSRRHALCPDICGPFCVRPDMWSVLSPVSTITSLLPVLSKQNYQQHHCPFQSSISSSSAVASGTGPEFDFWFKSVTFTKPPDCALSPSLSSMAGGGVPMLCFCPLLLLPAWSSTPCSLLTMYHSLPGSLLPAPCYSLPA